MMNVNKNVNSIASIDIVNFYPSVSYQMIEKAVWHFAKKIKGIERERLKTGLKLLKTGMSKQIVQFDGTYYKYKGNDPNDPGLTIGGYESAFGSDLVVSMLFDIIKPKLFTQIKLHNSINPQKLILNEIYRDDGILITKTKWTIPMFEEWINKFQQKVNNILGSDKLQFTLDIWELDDATTPSTNPKVSINSKNEFPFLDIKLYWNTNDELEFEVYFKKN